MIEITRFDRTKVQVKGEPRILSSTDEFEMFIYEINTSIFLTETCPFLLVFVLMGQNHTKE